MLTRITAIAVALLILILSLIFARDTLADTADYEVKKPPIGIRIMRFTPHDSENDGSLGFSIEASGVHSKDFGILVTFDMFRMEIPEYDHSTADDTLHIFSLNFNALYLFGTGRSGIVRPYAGAGFGIGYVPGNGVRGEEENGYLGGSIQAIGGLGFFLSENFSVDAECRYSIAGMRDDINYGGVYIGGGFSFH